MPFLLIYISSQKKEHSNQLKLGIPNSRWHQSTERETRNNLEPREQKRSACGKTKIGIKSPHFSLQCSAVFCIYIVTSFIFSLLTLETDSTSAFKSCAVLLLYVSNYINHQLKNFATLLAAVDIFKHGDLS